MTVWPTLLKPPASLIWHARMRRKQSQSAQRRATLCCLSSSSTWIDSRLRPRQRQKGTTPARQNEARPYSSLQDCLVAVSPIFGRRTSDHRVAPRSNHSNCQLTATLLNFDQSATRCSDVRRPKIGLTATRQSCKDE